MLKISKNIETPEELYHWLSKNREGLIRSIKNKYFSARAGHYSPIYIRDKIKLTRPYDKKEVEVQVNVVSKETFIAKGWDENYYAYADTSSNTIWLNTDILFKYTKSERGWKFIQHAMVHEITHIIDPKLYDPDLDQRDDLPYFKRPYEFDAYSAGFSDIMRNKYEPEYILKMLKDTEVWNKHPNKPKALKEWSPKQLRLFKIRLYHDVIKDMEEEREGLEGLESL